MPKHSESSCISQMLTKAQMTQTSLDSENTTDTSIALLPSYTSGDVFN